MLVFELYLRINLLIGQSIFVCQLRIYRHVTIKLYRLVFHSETFKTLLEQISQHYPKDCLSRRGKADVPRDRESVDDAKRALRGRHRLLIANELNDVYQPPAPDADEIMPWFIGASRGRSGWRGERKAGQSSRAGRASKVVVQNRTENGGNRPLEA